MGEKVLYEIVSKNNKQQHNGDPSVFPKSPKGFGARHTQALLLFICLTVGYTQRANLSVSMVAMTSPTDYNDCGNSVMNRTEDFENRTIGNFTNNVDAVDVDARDCGSKEPSKWSVYRKYAWHKSTQEMIVFSFFVGYTSMQLPMGYFAQKCGGKKPIMLGLAVNGVVSLVTPWLPMIGGWLALCTARLIQGMTQAAFYPSIHTLLAKWAPLSERGRLSTYVYSGSQFGTIVVFQVSGLFAGSPSFGWPATFWFTGVLSLASLALLAWLGAASPHEHPTITTEEMTFIMEGGSADVVHKKRSTPWKHILTSKAVWALVATHAGSAAGYILVLTQIPTYMNYVLGVEIKKNGFLSSLPYVSMYLTALVFGWLADFVANKKLLTICNIRRLTNSTGMVLSGCFLIGFSYASSTFPAVVMLVFTLGLHSAVHVGFHINHIDLAPNFAGNIMALGNMVANLTSLLVPVVVSNVVRDDMKNQHRWQIVFLLFAGLQFVTNTIFVTFCKGDVQPWNFYGEDGNDIEKEDTKAALEKKNSIKQKELMTNS